MILIIIELNIFILFYKNYFSNYEFNENFIDSNHIKIVKILFKKNYNNYNIDNFIYNHLSRESQYFNINLNNYYIILYHSITGFFYLFFLIKEIYYNYF